MSRTFKRHRLTISPMWNLGEIIDLLIDWSTSQINTSRFHHTRSLFCCLYAFKSKSYRVNQYKLIEHTNLLRSASKLLHTKEKSSKTFIHLCCTHLTLIKLSSSLCQPLSTDRNCTEAHIEVDMSGHLFVMLPTVPPCRSLASHRQEAAATESGSEGKAGNWSGGEQWHGVQAYNSIVQPQLTLMRPYVL